MTSRALLASLLLAAVACSSAASTEDAAPAPEDTPAQASPRTPPGSTTPPPPASTGTPPVDDAGADATKPVTGDPTAILGTLGGACGTIAALLGSPSPSLLNDQLVFVAGETYERASLSPGGQTIFDTPNAGGSSVESEVMSYEVLHFCEGASLLKTETQIDYAKVTDGGPASITDILVSINGVKVGVSVTRAYRPSNQTFGDADVKALLEKKLEGINVSSARVLPADKWQKQILHVFAANKAAVDAIGRVYPTIASAVRADTIVLVTQTTGGGFVYCNPDPPLGSECP